MKRYLCILLCLLLAACAGNPRLQEVRALADDAPKLAGFSDLSQRYRDTFQREQPYLSPAAAQREEAIDRKRHEAYPDFVALHTAATTYLRALGALTGGDTYDFGDQVKHLSESIKAWPDTGLTDRHVDAYARLVRVLVRATTGRAQDRAVQAMLREGYEPLQGTLDAMHTLLRFFNKNHDNEQRIVLGMLEVEIPYTDAPRDRLLAALARSHQQEKSKEYRLLGLRHTLAAQNVEAIRERHAALVRGPDPLPATAARSADADDARHAAGAAAPAIPPANAQGALP
jgi:predicted nucleic acid-binding protein